MLVTILAHIIVALGIAVLATFVVIGVVLSFKKFLATLKEKLSKKVGSTVVVANMRRVAQESIKEAKKKGNVKRLNELQELVNSDEIAIVIADENGNFNEEDIEIYKTDEMEKIVPLMDEDGSLVISA